MSGVMTRTLAILERLAIDVGGVSIAVLADDLGIPRSATHRLLTELAENGFVRQSRKRGDYVLTTKLVSLGLNYLKHSGVVDLCQPVLDRLAESSGELVRLGVVDVDHLTWVALSQGARSGLRYDPDMGIDAQLSCTATGFAWLSTLDEDDATALVLRQGIGKPERFGPKAPTSMNAVLKAVRQTGKQGFAIATDSYARGLSAISAPIVRTGADVGMGAVGVIAISGPAARLTDKKMRSLVPELLAAAADIASASKASPLFDRAYASTPAADLADDDAPSPAAKIPPRKKHQLDPA
ncbi:MAG: transcriptional regulator, IclR family [Variovorax sp.]|jgi:IclR family acetate operon transcriptional repressor|nr:transcriptional regulator, IclR family [Variovorax sp.]